MVAISFSVFKEKILDGTKTQTIRRYKPQRYEQLKKKGALQLYWKQRTKECELLMRVGLQELFIIKFTYRKENFAFYTYEDGAFHFDRYATPTESKEIITRDGFRNVRELFRWFFEHYGPEMNSTYFMVIRWMPRVWGASTTAAGGQ